LQLTQCTALLRFFATGNSIGHGLAVPNSGPGAVARSHRETLPRRVNQDVKIYTDVARGPSRRFARRTRIYFGFLSNPGICSN